MAGGVAKTTKIYDDTAEEYAASTFDIGKFPDVKRDADLFILETGARILDIGSGSGRDLLYFAGHGKTVTGIDLSRGLAQEALKRSLEGVLLMDMRQLAFPDQTFDGLWSCASLLHLPRKKVKVALKEFNRVLKPDGVLYLSVKKGHGERYDKSGKFFSYYQLPELSDLLNDGGFDLTEQRSSVDSRGIEWLSVFAYKRQV